MIFSSVNIEERKRLDIKSGDTVRIWQRIKEGEKTRRQAFEGLIIARKHGTEPGATFTVRKIAAGSIGVELTLPLYSPNIEKIELVSRSKVRRAKLYYIRERAVRAARRKMKQTKQVGKTVLEEKKLEKKETEKETAENKTK